MKKMIFAIVFLAMGTQASAGTALVLHSQSGLSMIYPVADYAGDTEDLQYDVAICDNDYENCLEFTSVPTHSKSQGTSYKAGECEISITKSEEKEKVSITKGNQECKLQNGAALESIAPDLVFDYNM